MTDNSMLVPDDRALAEHIITAALATRRLGLHEDSRAALLAAAGLHQRYFDPQTETGSSLAFDLTCALGEAGEYARGAEFAGTIAAAVSADSVRHPIFVCLAECLHEECLPADAPATTLIRAFQGLTTERPLAPDTFAVVKLAEIAKILALRKCPSAAIVGKRLLTLTEMSPFAGHDERIAASKRELAKAAEQCGSLIEATTTLSDVLNSGRTVRMLLDTLWRDDRDLDADRRRDLLRRVFDLYVKYFALTDSLGFEIAADYTIEMINCGDSTSAISISRQFSSAAGIHQVFSSYFDLLSAYEKERSLSQDRSTSSIERHLAAMEEKLGHDEPEAVAAQLVLFSSAISLRDGKASKRLAARALTVLDGISPENASEFTVTLRIFALAFLAQAANASSGYGTARSCLEQALRLANAIDVLDPRVRLLILTGLATSCAAPLARPRWSHRKVTSARQSLDQAREAMAEAAKILESLSPAQQALDAHRLVFPASHIASAIGDPLYGEGIARQMLAITRAFPEVIPHREAEIRATMALLMLEQGKVKAACAHLDWAIPVLERVYGKHSLHLRILKFMRKWPTIILLAMTVPVLSQSHGIVDCVPNEDCAEPDRRAGRAGE